MKRIVTTALVALTVAVAAAPAQAYFNPKEIMVDKPVPWQ
jgi:hypothetical protein